MFLKDFTNEEAKENFIRLAAITLETNKSKNQTNSSQNIKNAIKVVGLGALGITGALAAGMFFGLAYGFADGEDQKRRILSDYILEANLKEFDLQGALDDGQIISQMQYSELAEEIKELVLGADLKFYVDFKMLVAGLEQNDILNLIDKSIRSELKASDEIINLCNNWVTNTLFFTNYVKKELRID